ncbi:putative Ig domain-containing protein [Herbaspirillum seropedicae]|uniref:putative Ig domain-containing protein n=1 Tax=Herbaspirillum seropedicae TaxID=964 RepID=UPI003F8D35C9
MSYTIELHINTPAGIPHAFISISGPGLSRPVTVGYYPIEHEVSGAGTVRNDATSYALPDQTFGLHPSTKIYTFSISDQQAMNALQFIGNVANDPGNYELIGSANKTNLIFPDGYQCTGFARDVLQAAGLSGKGMEVPEQLPNGLSTWIQGINELSKSLPASLGFEYAYLDSNQVQPYRGSPTQSEIDDKVTSIYGGILKFDRHDHNSGEFLPVKDGGTTPTSVNYNVVDPTGLGTASRNSSNFVSGIDPIGHGVIIKSGGTLSDIWLLQKSSSNGYSNRDEFYAAVLQSNPEITDVNKIKAGQKIYVPQKLSDGSQIFYYSNGVSTTTNSTTGEFKMTVPSSDGGTTYYERKVVGRNDAGESIYEVRQTVKDKAGSISLDLEGLQIGTDGEVSYTKAVSTSSTQTETLTDSNGDGRPDKKETTLLNGSVSIISRDTNADGKWDNVQTIINSVIGSVNTILDGNGQIDIAKIIRNSSPSNAGSTSDVNISVSAYPLATVTLLDGNGNVVSVANGSVSMSNAVVNSNNFLDALMAGMASGGIRPGASQLNSNIDPGRLLNESLGLGSPNTGYGFGSGYGFGYSGLAELIAANGLGIFDGYRYIDPLLLDLSGDGVHMTSVENGVLFDTTGTGALTKTAWTDKKSGMLVVVGRDRDVKNISQLFSENYAGWQAAPNVLADQKRFSDGFDALASEDTNQDGLIDSHDTVWSHLNVWVDENHNGKVDGGELKDLTSLGINQISLQATASKGGDSRDGNQIVKRGEITINGQSREMLSVNFAADSAKSKQIYVKDGVYIQTSNNKGAVVAFATSHAEGTTLSAAELGASNIFGGVGDDTLIAASTGSWLTGGAGSNTYVGGVGDDVFVISASDSVANIHGNGGKDTALIVGKQGVTLNMSAAGLTVAEGGGGDDIIISGSRNGVFIKGGTGNDILIGGDGDDVIVGGTGKNTIVGGSGKSVIYAGPNGDLIYGGAKDSIINAGGGDDRIFAGDGNDVIVVGKGNARIDGGKGINTLAVHGSYTEYKVVQYQDGYWIADQVPDRDGTVFVKNVQRVAFTDITALLDTTPIGMPDVLVKDSNGRAFDRQSVHIISASQILRNDHIVASDRRLHIVNVADAVGGVVKLLQNGDVSFVPDSTFAGVMSFKYSVQDENGYYSEIKDKNGQVVVSRATVTLLSEGMPDDPLFAKELYLNDVNVIPVWKDYTGKGVRIAQIEAPGSFATGPEVLNYTLSDLRQNIDQDWLSRQISAGTLPSQYSVHATNVAGIMIAARDGKGMVGVAYDAKLAEFGLVGDDVAPFAEMPKYDIVNNSWADTIPFSSQQLDAALMQGVYQTAALNGRAGLGTVIVAGAGNTRAQGGNAESTNRNNNRFVIQVGGVDSKEDLSTLITKTTPFSSPGASILVSAPSSKILTTTQLVESPTGALHGSDYLSGDGTSLATPIVSGVVALMLEANPNLGYRDVQQILALSARKIDGDISTQWTNNSAQNWNGGGMHVSDDYGMGMVDARAAVRLAESWSSQQTFSNEKSVSNTSGVNEKIVPAGQTVSSTLALAQGVKIEHVEVFLYANLAKLEDLIVTLISPTGTRSILLNKSSAPQYKDGALNSFGYTFTSTHDWGEASQGNWTLEIKNINGVSPIYLESWVLRAYGADAIEPTTYYFTDELKGLLLATPSRGQLAAVAGSSINAAAVSGNSVIDLVTGTANLGGSNLSISTSQNIADIFTGDGDDILIGGNRDGVLDGGRGKNQLTGGSGTNVFVVRERQDGLDVISLFDPSAGDRIDFVGFGDKKFSDFRIAQLGGDARLDLGNGQLVILKNFSVSNLSSSSIYFQNTFQKLSNPISTVATKRLTGGGGGGVSTYTSSTGSLSYAPVGTVYNHDSSEKDVFVVAQQVGQSNYQNWLNGFKAGTDQIDLTELGIKNFDDLIIEPLFSAKVGVAPIAIGAQISTILSGSKTPVFLLNLIGVSYLQLKQSDFLFAPGGYAVVSGGGATTVVASSNLFPSKEDKYQITKDASGKLIVSSSIDYSLSDAQAALYLQGEKKLIGVASDNGALISGNDGYDTLIGGTGDDVLIAGAGGATLIGNKGHNKYVLDGKGVDSFVDASGGSSDELWLRNVLVSQVSLAKSGFDLLVSVGSTDGSVRRITVQNQFDGKGVADILIGANRITATQIAGLISDENFSLVPSNALSPMVGGKLWSVNFSDLFGVNDSKLLTYLVTTKNGSPLPDWLKFDPIAQTLSGIAPNTWTGTEGLKVVARNMAGKEASVTLAIVMQPTYATPTLVHAISSQQITAGVEWRFTLSEIFSSAVVDDTLTYRATEVGRIDLPSWLSFDAATRTFHGTPTAQAIGALSLSIVAVDVGGFEASTALDLTVTANIKAPLQQSKLLGVALTNDGFSSYQVPVGIFGEVGIGDHFEYSAALKDGDPLPSWLIFDSTNQRIAGIWPSDRVGAALDVVVTVRNSRGQTSSVVLIVADQNYFHQPNAIGILPGQQLKAGMPWSYSFAGAFASESMDVLEYSFALENGASLPSWISFNAATLSLEGAPSNKEIGNLDVVVTAKDLLGYQSSRHIFLQVASDYRPPVIDVPNVERVALVGESWNYALNFRPAVVGDDLHFVATLSNGDALPPWLHFDTTTQTLSGSPPSLLSSPLQIKVVAIDAIGLQTTATVALQVSTKFATPIITQPVETQYALAGQTWSYKLPDNLVTIAPGDSVTYKVTNADGSALPSWLNFDPVEHRLWGSPTDFNQGSLPLRLTVSDTVGLSANVEFYVRVIPIYQIPVLTRSLEPQIFDAGTVLNYSLPKDLFATSIAGDSLSYTAMLENGEPLPYWLHFDSATMTLSTNGYFLGNSFAGMRKIKIVATDSGGLSSATTFSFEIKAHFAAPIASDVDPNLLALYNDRPWSLVLSKIIKPAPGDSVTYEVSQANGEALPTWFFMKETMSAGVTLFAKSITSVSSTLSIKVTAKNGVGMVTSKIIDLKINPEIYAPKQVIEQSSSVYMFSQPENASFFTIEGSRFNVQAGDGVMLKLVMADGTPLPKWLEVSSVSNTGRLFLRAKQKQYDTQLLKLKIIATETIGGLSSEWPFEIAVNPQPVELKTSAGLVSEQRIEAGKAYAFDLKQLSGAISGPSLSFRVFDQPSWLAYDPATYSLSGTAPNDFSGTVVRIVAKNSVQDSATFYLALGNPGYSAPRLSTQVIGRRDVMVGASDVILAYPDQFFVAAPGDQIVGVFATLANGQSLPGSFSITNDSIKIKAGNRLWGDVDVKIYGYDIGGLLTSTTVSLHIAPSDTTPSVGFAQSQRISPDVDWSYEIPSTLFSKDAYVFSATLEDGSPLPSWLHFSPDFYMSDYGVVNFRRANYLYGHSPAQNGSVIKIKLTGKNGAGLSSSVVLPLYVDSKYAGPSVNKALPDVMSSQLTDFTMSIRSDIFYKPVADDALTYNVTLEDGSSLPSWLSFSQKNKSLVGKATINDGGVYRLKLTATDLGGYSASVNFKWTVELVKTVSVVPLNISPIIVGAESWTIDLSAGFKKSASTNIAALRYAISMTDGRALPSWISFDSVTGVLSAQAARRDVGAYAFNVAAIEPGGLTTTNTFSAEVKIAYASPSVNNLPSQFPTVSPDGVISYSLPTDLFKSAYLEDSITLHATKEDGSALYSWMSFDPTTLKFTGRIPDDFYGPAFVSVYAEDEGGMKSQDVRFAFASDHAAKGGTRALLPNVSYAFARTGAFDYSYRPEYFFTSKGQRLSGVLTLEDGTPLPSWLHYDQGHILGNSAGDVDLTLKLDLRDESGVTVGSSKLVFWFRQNVTVADHSIQTSSLSIVSYSGRQFDVSTDNNIIVLDRSAERLTYSGSNEKILVSGSHNEVRAISGSDSLIALTGDMNHVEIGESSAKVIVNGNSNLVSMGRGTNEVAVFGSDVRLELGSGNYKLSLTGSKTELQFMEAVSSDDVWFQHIGSDLSMQILSTGSRSLLVNWYGEVHADNALGGIKAGGKIIGQNNIENLVQAMASFGAPAAGQTSLTEGQRQSLQPILAANWT